MRQMEDIFSTKNANLSSSIASILEEKSVFGCKNFEKRYALNTLQNKVLINGVLYVFTFIFDVSLYFIEYFDHMNRSWIGIVLYNDSVYYCIICISVCFSLYWK